MTGGEKVTKNEFQKVYNMYFTQVHLYLLKLTGDKHLAEEITSETFFKALKSIDKFDNKCSIGSWLCQIAKNTYYSHLQKNKRYVELDEVIETATSDTNIEETIENASVSMEILKVLHTLDEPYKEVFTLRILGELSFAQIGEIYNKTANWACVTYHRARQKIKDQMEE